jgi:hypothetical protein
MVVTTMVIRSTMMVRHHRFIHGLLELLPRLLHTQLCEHVGDEPAEGTPHRGHLLHVPDLQPLGENPPRAGDDASDNALMDCTLESLDARHPEGTPSNSRILMKLASRGTNVCPTLSLLQHERKLRELKKEWSSFCSMERTGEELLMEGDRRVEEVYESAFVRAEKIRKEHRSGARRRGQVTRSRQGALMVGHLWLRVSLCASLVTLFF